MSLSITRSQRSLLFFFSASGYIAWCSGLEGRLEAEIITAPHLATIASLPQRPPPRLSSIIVRDPFAEELPDSAPVAVRDSSDGDSSFPSAALADDGPSVPNIADLPGGDAPPAQTLALKATIVGPNPVAYVQAGTAMEIVRVGDLLRGRRVDRIDLEGVDLSDGSRLVLPNTFAAAAPSEMARSAEPAVSPADLRQTVVRQAAGNAPTPEPAPQAAPTPSPAPPSPGPLPTVNQNGIPVGVNPTSDPNAPTPYPYPYPYAPQR
jgi:hypothetical protein